jgi:hypothetical protein
LWPPVKQTLPQHSSAYNKSIPFPPYGNWQVFTPPIPLVGASAILCRGMPGPPRYTLPKHSSSYKKSIPSLPVGASAKMPRMPAPSQNHPSTTCRRYYPAQSNKNTFLHLITVGTVLVAARQQTSIYTTVPCRATTRMTKHNLLIFCPCLLLVFFMPNYPLVRQKTMHPLPNFGRGPSSHSRKTILVGEGESNIHIPTTLPSSTRRGGPCGRPPTDIFSLLTRKSVGINAAHACALTQLFFIMTESPCSLLLI